MGGKVETPKPLLSGGQEGKFYLAICALKGRILGTSLAVQWLRLCVSTAGGTGSIPGRGTKIPHATCGVAKNFKK